MQQDKLSTTVVTIYQIFSINQITYTIKDRPPQLRISLEGVPILIPQSVCFLVLLPQMFLHRPIFARSLLGFLQAVGPYDRENHLPLSRKSGLYVLPASMI
jgi:hypothetical protein